MKVLALFMLFALVFAAGSVPRSGKVIYGTDDRMDTFQVSNSLQNLGDGAVIIIFGASDVLTENGDGTWTATSTATAEDFWGYCPSERFSQQVILSQGLGFCSGFLLSTNPPWVGTAAHCTAGSTTGAFVIFGFELTSSSNTRTTFAANDVYFVDDVVVSGTSSGGAGDYGIFELDRPVSGHTPYTSFNGNLSVNDDVVMIGHPNGLPKKTDDGGEVQSVSSTLIGATVDAYGGNSGSPVFDSNGNLAGILVGGAPDFVTYSPCSTSNVCPGGTGCTSTGENIVPICALLESSSTVSNMLGDCSGNGTNDDDDDDDESAGTNDDDDESAGTNDDDDESTGTNDDDDESAGANDDDDESSSSAASTLSVMAAVGVIAVALVM